AFAALGLAVAGNQPVHFAGQVGRAVQQHAVVARQVRQQGGEGGAGGGVGLAAQAALGLVRGLLRCGHGGLGTAGGGRHRRRHLERGRCQRLGNDLHRLGRQQRRGRQDGAEQEKESGRPTVAGGSGGWSALGAGFNRHAAVTSENRTGG